MAHSFSVKVILSNRAKQDGTRPVQIRVIINRDVKRVNTPYSVREDQFVSNPTTAGKWIVKHKDADIINAALETKRSELTNFISLANITGATLGVEDVNKPKQGTTGFYALIEKHLKLMKEQQHAGSFNKNQTRLRNLREVWGKNDVPVEAITKDRVDQYLTARIKKGMSPNTYKKDLGYFSQILVEYGGGSADNFFTKANKKLSFQDTVKEKLTEAEIHALETTHYTGDLLLARDMFLFAYYSQGVRFGDVAMLTRDAVHKQLIEYRMGKTAKIRPIIVHPKLVALVEPYMTKKTPYLFPILKEEITNAFHKQKAIGVANAKVNAWLKQVAALAGISKNVSTHIARHTFASLALNNGTDIKTLQTVLGHGDSRTTEKYAGELLQAQVNRKVSSLYK